MVGLNKVMIIGCVGNDPKADYTKNSNAVCELSVATNSHYKNKEGKTVEETEWHNIVLWGQNAEYADREVIKGRKVFVEGRIKTRTWVNKSGEKKYKTEIHADRFEAL